MRADLYQGPISASLTCKSLQSNHIVIQYTNSQELTATNEQNSPLTCKRRATPANKRSCNLHLQSLTLGWKVRLYYRYGDSSGLDIQQVGRSDITPALNILPEHRQCGEANEQKNNQQKTIVTPTALVSHHQGRSKPSLSSKRNFCFDKTYSEFAAHRSIPEWYHGS